MRVQAYHFVADISFQTSNRQHIPDTQSDNTRADAHVIAAADPIALFVGDIVVTVRVSYINRRISASLSSRGENTNRTVQGVGAKSPTVAHMLEQVPRAPLQATMAAGAAGAATVPNVAPAAA